MSHLVIEVADSQVGLVIRERGGFRFFAADRRVRALEGRVFRSAGAASRAADALLKLDRPERTAR